MKMLPGFRCLLTALLLLSGAAVAAEGDSQSSFQVSPPPCPYPYFVPGRQDYKLTGTYIGMKMDKIKFTGVGLDLLARVVSQESMALNLEGGFMGLFCGDFPMNMTFSGMNRGDLIRTETRGKWSFDMWTIPLAMNLELQAVHSPQFDAIVFVGPNIGIGWGSMTPASYRAWIYDTNYDGKFNYPTATGEYGMYMNMMTYGLKGGLQLGIPAGPIEIAPFFMMNSMMGGSATVTMKTGYKELKSESFTGDVGSSFSTSFGADFIVSSIGLSIGAVLQQIMAQKKEENQSVTLISLGYHWVDRKPVQESGKVKEEPAPSSGGTLKR